MSHSAFERAIPGHVRAAAGVTPLTATDRKFWSGLSSAVMEQIADNWEATRRAYRKTRRQHYFSAEFLQGRALLNNLTNLDLVDDAVAASQAASSPTSSRPSTMPRWATVAWAALLLASSIPPSRRITQ